MAIVIYNNSPFTTEYIPKMTPWQRKCNAYFYFFCLVFTVGLLVYWSNRPSREQPKYRAQSKHTLEGKHKTWNRTVRESVGLWGLRNGREGGKRKGFASYFLYIISLFNFKMVFNVILILICVYLCNWIFIYIIKYLFIYVFTYVSSRGPPLLFYWVSWKVFPLERQDPSQEKFRLGSPVSHPAQG